MGIMQYVFTNPEHMRYERLLSPKRCLRDLFCTDNSSRFIYDVCLCVLRTGIKVSSSLLSDQQIESIPALSRQPLEPSGFSGRRGPTFPPPLALAAAPVSGESHPARCHCSASDSLRGKSRAVNLRAVNCTQEFLSLSGWVVSLAAAATSTKGLEKHRAPAGKHAATQVSESTPL